MPDEVADTDLPVFKKRNRGGKGTSVSALQEEEPKNSEPDQRENRYVHLSYRPGVEELVALRGLLRRPAGIELSQLNKGGNKQKCRESQAEHISDLNTDAVSRFVHKHNFQAETGTIDVKQPMYVACNDTG